MVYSSLLLVYPCGQDAYNSIVPPDTKSDFGDKLDCPNKEAGFLKIRCSGMYQPVISKLENFCGKKFT